MSARLDAQAAHLQRAERRWLADARRRLQQVRATPPTVAARARKRSR